MSEDNTLDDDATTMIAYRTLTQKWHHGAKKEEQETFTNLSDAKSYLEERFKAEHGVTPTGWEKQEIPNVQWAMDTEKPAGISALIHPLTIHEDVAPLLDDITEGGGCDSDGWY